jgi:hypothetical protein
MIQVIVGSKSSTNSPFSTIFSLKVLLIMRTYALYDQNIWILLFICAAGLAVIVFGTVSIIYSVKSVINALTSLAVFCHCQYPRLLYSRNTARYWVCTTNEHD